MGRAPGRLTGDIEDIELVVSYLSQHFPSATRLFLCGMSTGAFLALAAAARPPPQLPSRSPTRLRLCGVFVLACVDDIPASVAVDFDAEQRRQAEEQGWCDKSFWPWTPGKSKEERWRLGSGYLQSYSCFPRALTLAHSLRAPLLLLHGDRDTHVPVGHSQRLASALAAAGAGFGTEEAVELAVLAGGNHFLSSSKALKASLAAVRKFVARC